jgi:hypothetical protein
MPRAASSTSVIPAINATLEAIMPKVTIHLNQEHAVTIMNNRANWDKINYRFVFQFLDSGKPTKPKGVKVPTIAIAIAKEDLDAGGTAPWAELSGLLGDQGLLFGDQECLGKSCTIKVVHYLDFHRSWLDQLLGRILMLLASAALKSLTLGVVKLEDVLPSPSTWHLDGEWVALEIGTGSATFLPGTKGGLQITTIASAGVNGFLTDPGKPGAAEYLPIVLAGETTASLELGFE